MCGGTTKSSVFEMHGCGGAGYSKRSQEFVNTMQQPGLDLEKYATTLDSCAKGLADMGQIMSDVAGRSGNEIAMQHQQDMISSYKSLEAAEKGMPADGAKLASAVAAAKVDYETVFGTEQFPRVNGTAVDMERVTQNFEKASQAAEKALYAYHELAKQCYVDSGSVGSMAEFDEEKDRRERGDSLQFYREALEDSNHSPGSTVVGSSEAWSTTCAGEPILPVNWIDFGHRDTRFARCAEKCRATLSPAKCVGFQVYEHTPNNGAPVGYSCEMFSSVTKLTQHTKPVNQCNNQVQASCWLPVTDTTTFGNINKDKHTIDMCFGEAGAGSMR
jgi:hypothetical protein